MATNRRIFAFAGAHFGNVDMEIPDGVVLELLLRLVAFNIEKAADPMSLQTAMQRRSPQMRNAGLEAIQAVIQWQ